MTDDESLRRFRARMARIPVAVRAAVIPAVQAGAQEIAIVQRLLAPEASGALKASIAVTGPGETTPPYSQPGGSRAARQTEALVTAGNSDVRYAHLVEHGTAAAPAQPFFWPGFRLTRKRASARIKRAMSKAIREHWGKP